MIHQFNIKYNNASLVPLIRCLLGETCKTQTNINSQLPKKIALMKSELTGQVTSEVRTGHEVDVKALDSFLASNLEGYPDSGSLSVRQFTVGQSNPTFLAVKGDKKYVVRKQPAGVASNKTAHQVHREFKVLQSLHQSTEPYFPVPQAHVLSRSKELLGSEFYVMDFVPGRLLLNAGLQSIPTQHRMQYFEESCRVLALMHSLPFWNLGLDSYGSNGGFLERQVKSMSYVSEQQEKVPGVFKLNAKLQGKKYLQHIPDEEICLMHGDFKFDNFLFDPKEPQIVGVLDWELSTIGHPLADVANLVNYIYGSPYEEETKSEVSVVSTGLMGLSDSELRARNLPTLDDMLGFYLAWLRKYSSLNNGSLRRVFECDIIKLKKKLQIFQSFYLWRGAIIAQGIQSRLLLGQNSNPDAEKFVHKMFDLSDAARKLMEDMDLPKNKLFTTPSINISEYCDRKLDLTKFIDQNMFFLVTQTKFKFVCMTNSNNSTKLINFHFNESKYSEIISHTTRPINSSHLLDNESGFFRFLARQPFKHTTFFEDSDIIDLYSLHEPTLSQFHQNQLGYAQFIEAPSYQMNGLKFRQVIRKKHCSINFIAFNLQHLTFFCDINSQSGQIWNNESKTLSFIRHCRIEKDMTLSVFKDSSKIEFKFENKFKQLQRDDLKIAWGVMVSEDLSSLIDVKSGQMIRTWVWHVKYGGNLLKTFPKL